MLYRPVIVNHGLLAVLPPGGAIEGAPMIPPPPPPGTPNSRRFFRALLGSGGADAGTLNQAVNGAVTPAAFWLGAHSDFDIHIVQVTAVIIDIGIAHNRFGGLAALTTGWDLRFKENGEWTNLVQRAKTAGEAIAGSGFGRPFGGANDAFELANYSGNEDAQIINITLGDYVPGGARIGRGNSDRLESVINDDLTGITAFYVYAFGFRNMPL